MLALIAQNSSSNGNPLTLAVPLLLMGGVFYFLLIRPQQRRMRAQQALIAAVQVGDEVLTTGGIFGTVTEVDDDEGTISVEIAPGTRIRMVKTGISRRLVDEEEELYEDEPEEEDDPSS
jgi:preprotein translocase subunit YajC